MLKILFLLSFLSLAGNEFDFKIQSKDKVFDFSKYDNVPLLIVNIATKCGYTGQLEGLEKLYQKYKGKLLVVGIPSNDFMGQTPEGDKEVVKFCRLNYGVTFPITPKSIIKGNNKIDLYKYLTLRTNNEEVSWNFNKFLISKDRKTIKRFSSGTRPMSQEMIRSVESLVK